MKSGVYTITNIINNKIYVGSTNNFVRRFNDHKKELINNIHKNNYLQRSYNKHGINNFIFEILEECEPEIRLGIEQYWINVLNVCNRKYGYNITPTAGNNSGYKYTEEQKENISNGLKKKFETGYKGSTFGKKYTQIELDNIYNAKIKKGSIKIIPIYVYDINDNFLFFENTLKKVSKLTNVDRADISRILKNKQKYSKGYKFKYNLI
jgi:group I intron endonuclease